MWDRLIHNRRFLWAVRTLWLMYAAAQIVSTHLPDPDEIVVLPDHSDKPIHAAIFFILALLTAASFPGWLVKGKNALKLVAMLAVYAAADELSQGPFGRTTDGVDWACDLTGIVLGTALVWTVLRRLASSARPMAPANSRGELSPAIGSRVQV